MSDQDVIQKLLEVEHKADELVVEAEQEADRRIAAARDALKKSYQEEFARKTAELEECLRTEKLRLEDEKRNRLAAHLASLAAVRPDIDRFFRRVDELVREGLSR